MYEECGNAGLVCRRCGISRPTLRKWAKRYRLNGIASLESQSKHPHSSPDAKITDELRALNLEMRKRRNNLGARRLQTELIRLHQVHLSTGTIHKVLSEASVNRL
jgi:transposase-like protein